MKVTANYKKHHHKNPVQRFLIGNFYKALLSEAKNLNPDSTLDVGCGEGFTLQKLKESGINSRMEGIDYSKASISLGKKIHPGLDLKIGDTYDLPYKDNSFDLVLCIEVLEHLKEPAKAIKEIKRVTKKYAIFSVPNEPFFRLANFSRGKNLSRLGNDIEHIQHWSSGSFAKLVQSQFRISNVRRPFPLTLVVAQKIS